MPFFNKELFLWACAGEILRRLVFGILISHIWRLKKYMFCGAYIDFYRNEDFPIQQTITSSYKVKSKTLSKSVFTLSHGRHLFTLDGLCTYKS